MLRKLLLTMSICATLALATAAALPSFVANAEFPLLVCPESTGCSPEINDALFRAAVSAREQALQFVVPGWLVFSLVILNVATLALALRRSSNTAVKRDAPQAARPLP